MFFFLDPSCRLSISETSKRKRLMSDRVHKNWYAIVPLGTVQKTWLATSFAEVVQGGLFVRRQKELTPGAGEESNSNLLKRLETCDSQE